MNRRLVERLRGSARELYQSWPIDSGNAAIDPVACMLEAADIIEQSVESESVLVKCAAPQCETQVELLPEHIAVGLSGHAVSPQYCDNCARVVTP